ncbi:MAG: hypothetical protein M1818_001466 [Claussenomyces sp. TS43310]|nr:MAG: hypothetical protein M1818_001466 [Claussenomyces sp. TS43310]
MPSMAYKPSTSGPAAEEPSSTDPAHPSYANFDHTTQSGEKPKSALEAVTDPAFLPTLADAPVHQKLKSHSLLVLLIFGAVFGAWFMGFSVLQFSGCQSWMELGLRLGSVATAALALIFWTGTGTIDLWSLIMEWGWYSIPVAATAGLIFVIMQERSESLDVID